MLSTTYNLTSEQHTIAVAPASTMSVFAAPGSGKTTVLTHHILYQLQIEKMRPEELLAVTFTKQAANEMRGRIRKALPSPLQTHTDRIRLGTFHAQMFAMLLQQTPNIPVLLDPKEQFQMLRTALQLQSLPSETQEVRRWLMKIARLSSAWPIPTGLDRHTRRVKMQYDRLKRLHHRWDFDDILVNACQVLEQGFISDRVAAVRYILMDEFQDTNAIQWQIVRSLAAQNQANLFVVGDDDQCIYGFRGANPEWLVHFGNWFPNAKLKYLNVNFRSDRQIIETTRQLIEKNRQRQPKDIRGASQLDGTVQTMTASSEAEEAHHVVQLIESHGTQGSIGVLARTRKQLEQTWSALPMSVRKHVEFRTFHDAKGKEWDDVHIVGAVANNPYLRRSDTPIVELTEEEERRIFYVAMTRAKHALWAHVPLKIQGMRQKPISFLEESGMQPL